jgi:hypothetical protein
MGYESKVYIVEDHRTKIMQSDKKDYASVVAVFCLGGMGVGQFEELFTNASITSCYFYADDGNTQVFEDRYGEELKEVSVNDLLSALEKDTETLNKTAPLIAFLEAIEQNPYWTNIKAIRYGY